MNEIWKSIVGYEDRYEVSNLANVRSLKRIVKFGNNKRTISAKNIIVWVGQDRYPSCFLHKNNKARHFRVHRLVAEAFIGPKPVGCEINHRDYNRSNSALSNLEYISHRDNLIHASENGMEVGKKKRPVVRLNDNTIFQSLHEAARAIGTNTTNVWYVCRGIRKHTRGFRFAYLEGK